MPRFFFIILAMGFFIMRFAFAATPMTAPTNLAATSTHATAMTLAWVGSPAGTFDEYRLRWRTDVPWTAGNWDSPCAYPSCYKYLIAPSEQSFTDAGLAAATTYYFALRACSSDACSGMATWLGTTADAIAATPPAPVIAPSAPTNAVVRPGATNDALIITWDSLASGTVHDYRVRWRIDAPLTEHNWNDACGFPSCYSLIATERSITQMQLVAGTTYFVGVRACADGTATSCSAIATAQGVPVAPPIPKQPSGFFADGNAMTTVALRWDSQSGVQSYTVKYTTGSLFTDPDWETAHTAVTALSGEATSMVVAGLSEGTTYTFAVRAKNESGSSDRAVVTHKTAAAPPVPAPITPSVVAPETPPVPGLSVPRQPIVEPPTNLRVAATTEQGVTMRWDPVATPATTYTIKYIKGSVFTDVLWSAVFTVRPGDDPDPVKTVAVGLGYLMSEQTIAGLTPGTTYAFAIRAFDANGIASVLVATSGKTKAMTIDPLQAATSAGLQGVVNDASGKAVAGAVVGIEGQGKQQSIVTGDAGSYQFVGLPAGAYRLGVSVPSARSDLQNRMNILVTLVAGTTQEHDITLVVKASTPPEFPPAPDVPPPADPRISPAPTSSPTLCMFAQQPVCGERNGVRDTYMNACFLQQAGATFVADGVCPALPDVGKKVCPQEYDPVCGSDGQTYPNSCTAEGVVQSYRAGACVAPSPAPDEAFARALAEARSGLNAVADGMSELVREGITPDAGLVGLMQQAETLYAHAKEAIDAGKRDDAKSILDLFSQLRLADTFASFRDNARRNGIPPERLAVLLAEAKELRDMLQKGIAELTRRQQDVQALSAVHERAAALLAKAEDALAADNRRLALSLFDEIQSLRVRETLEAIFQELGRVDIGVQMKGPLADAVRYIAALQSAMGERLPQLTDADRDRVTALLAATEAARAQGQEAMDRGDVPAAMEAVRTMFDSGNKALETLGTKAVERVLSRDDRAVVRTAFAVTAADLANVTVLGAKAAQNLEKLITKNTTTPEEKFIVTTTMSELSADVIKKLLDVKKRYAKEIAQVLERTDLVPSALRADMIATKVSILDEIDDIAAVRKDVAKIKGIKRKMLQEIDAIKKQLITFNFPPETARRVVERIQLFVDELKSAKTTTPRELAASVAAFRKEMHGYFASAINEKYAKGLIPAVNINESHPLYAATMALKQEGAMDPLVKNDTVQLQKRIDGATLEAMLEEAVDADLFTDDSADALEGKKTIRGADAVRLVFAAYGVPVPAAVLARPARLLAFVKNELGITMAQASLRAPLTAATAITLVGAALDSLSTK